MILWEASGAPYRTPLAVCLATVPSGGTVLAKQVASGDQFFLKFMPQHGAKAFEDFLVDLADARFG